MHPDEGYHDHAGTVMVIAWGQFMDHDYTLTGTPLGTILTAITAGFMRYNLRTVVRFIGVNLKNQERLGGKTD